MQSPEHTRTGGQPGASGELPVRPSPHPALRTKVCALFGIELPIVQTGMGWVSTSELVVATSRAGGLGILAASTLRYEELERSLIAIGEQTDRPFGVNIRSDQEDVERVANLLIRERVRVVSFAQVPSEALVKRFRDAGVLTMQTIATRRHAEKVAAWGMDALIAQGEEGGGHTGQIPTSLLLSSVTDAVDIPVLGAGGFFDGRGLVAALAWGAEGIAMGTRFLLTRESPVPDEIKRCYLEAGLADTVVSAAVDGVPQRVIRTEVVDRLERASKVTALSLALRNALRVRRLTNASFAGLLREGRALRAERRLSWAQTIMAANAPILTRATLVDGRRDAGILPSGQVTGAITGIPSVSELLDAIVEQANRTLERLTAGS